METLINEDQESPDQTHISTTTGVRPRTEQVSEGRAVNATTVLEQLVTYMGKQWT